MKTKITFLSIILCCMISIANAQDYNTSIGLRLGSPFCASYKTFLKGTNALELVAGYRGYTGYSWVNLGGYYEHHTDIKDVDGLMWYYGGGVNIYFWSFDDAYFPSNTYSSTTLGISGALGLDYKFKDAPVNLSLDWTPTLFFNGYTDGFAGGYGALSVRYVLK